MRTLPLLVPVLLAATLAVPASAQRFERPMLHGAECLDPDFARGFVDIDDRTLLVDAGRKRYLIQVAPRCINNANVLRFRSQPIVQRICGGSFDAVIGRDGLTCRIDRMELISKERYDSLLKERDDRRKARKAERRARG